MKSREYIIDNFSVTQATNGHVWVINNNPSGEDAFIRAHIQYPKRLTKRRAKRIITDIKALMEMEALNGSK